LTTSYKMGVLKDSSSLLLDLFCKSVHSSILIIINLYLFSFKTAIIDFV
jgi:hypothetical protein